MNEELGTADPLLTILFEGLWCLADRRGRLEDRPLRIKASVFPYREGLNVDEMLDWLVAHNFVIRYTVNDARYIQVLNFEKHQRPHTSEVETEIPEYKAVIQDGAKKSPDGVENQPQDALNTDSGFPLTDSVVPDGATAKAVHTGKVLARLLSLLGLKKFTPAEKRDWIQNSDLAFDNGFTAEEFTDCFADRLRQSNGRYTIKPQWVNENLPAFVKGRRKIEKLPTLEEIAKDEAEKRAIPLRPPPQIVGGVQ